MPALKSKPKFTADQVVVCWSGFATQEHTVSVGTQLRGDHPAVKAMPGQFVDDGTPESEWPTVWDTLPEPAVDEEPSVRQPAPIPDSEAAWCTQTFRKGRRRFEKGFTYRRDDPDVVANAAFFEVRRNLADVLIDKQ